MPKQNKELRSLQSHELNARIADLQKELIKTNAQVATGSAPKNPYQIKNAKRTIARILTIHQENKLKEAAKTATEANTPTTKRVVTKEAK